MNMTASPFELHALEKLREEELEEARAIHSVILPAKSLRAGAVMISHEFQPVASVGGDFPDYFELNDGSDGVNAGGGSRRGLKERMCQAIEGTECGAEEEVIRSSLAVEKT